MNYTIIALFVIGIIGGIVGAIYNGRCAALSNNEQRRCQ